MTRESYRLVENFLHFYILNIHVSLLLHSHHVNPYSLTRSYLCLLFHITNFMVSFSSSALSNFYHSSPSYSLFSITVALKQHMFFCFSTCPQPQQSSSYFHAILSLPVTSRHPPLTISLTLEPTLPSAKLSFLGHPFTFTYSFSLSESLNPFFHDCLPPPVFSHKCISSILSYPFSSLGSPFHSHSHPSAI